jgi:hypothetical protein
MWILKWLPDWIFYIILLIGVAGYIVTYLLRILPIPGIFMYRTVIQIVSVVLIVIGTFMTGAIYDNNSWLDKVREMELKVAESEKKSAEANAKIVEKVVTKTQVIKQKGDDIIKYVDREIVKKEEVVKFIENCPIPKDIVDAHNAAAILNKAAEGKK